MCEGRRAKGAHVGGYGLIMLLSRGEYTASCRQLSKLDDVGPLLGPQVADVKILNLHGNRLASLATSLTLPHLTSLNVSSNELVEVDGATCAQLTALVNLNAASNMLCRIANLGALAALETLVLPHNQLRDLKWLTAALSNLKTLDLRDNLIEDPTLLGPLGLLPNLTTVALQDDNGDNSNPACRHDEYNAMIWGLCARADQIDGRAERPPDCDYSATTMMASPMVSMPSFDRAKARRLPSIVRHPPGVWLACSVVVGASSQSCGVCSGIV